MGAGTLAGGAGLLLTQTSWPQPILFGVGGPLTVAGMLGNPVWFLLLGRHLAASP